MTRIFIENNEVDISQGISNLLTYAIDDLQNLDSKTTAFSKTIVLPGSSRNNDILGNIFDINNSNFTVDASPNYGYNFNAAKSAKCRIEVDGMQVIKGVFRLLEIIIDGKLIEYECAVFGELGGFFTSLSNKKIEDLDFSTYNHTYSIANIVASWDNANNGEGYFYPLIDYGDVSTDKVDFQYTAFRPSLFVKEYLHKIITGSGYTYESNFFETAFFKRLAIGQNAENLLGSVDTNYVNATRSTSFTNGLSSAAGNVYIDLPVNTLTNFTTSDNINFYYSGVSATTKCKAVITGSFLQPTSSGLGVRLESDLGGYTESSFIMPNGPLQNFEVTLEFTGTFLSGNLIRVVLLRTGSLVPSQITIDTITVTVDKEPAGIIELILDDNLVMNYQIPKGILQKDFFASILKMFNLMVTEDRYKEKHLVIEPYVNFYNTNPSTYLDWSDKLDRSQVIRIKPMSELNSRFYELNYKKDNDYFNETYDKKYNEGYGNRKYDTVYEFATETQKVEVIFSSSILYGKSGTDKVYPAIYKFSNGQETKMSHNIRIFQCKKITGVASWDILDGVSVVHTDTNYGYAGHFNDPDVPTSDINFGATRELYFALVTGDISNNLFNVYYSPYLAEITDKDSRLLTANFKLTPQDIYDLDFGRFIFIDGGLFRLSKVIDYNTDGTDLTKVELLRVLYTTY